MGMRERIAFDDLPAQLVELLHGRHFIKAYLSDNPGKIIVWTVDPTRDHQEEGEYDLARGRFLSHAEREQLFPPVRQMRLASLGAKLDIGHRLSHGEVLCQTYDIVRDGDAAPLHCEQTVYVPALDAVEDVVRNALERADFPARYAAWPADEKISYWVATLFRVRRHTGEQGTSPDAVFDATLIADLRRVDEHIDAILPQVIAQLARMEIVDPAAMLASFNAGTGARLPAAP